MLKIRNLSLQLEDKQVLKSIELEVAKGEILYILGPSGCGKTSLLRCIAGLQQPSSGCIELAPEAQHKNLKPQQQTSTSRKKIGMVFQGLALFPNMTVRDNILFAMPHFCPKLKQERLEFVLEILEIQALSNKYPQEISGGQQQRVALARVLAPMPQVILFDEAFSSLDEVLKLKISTSITKILKQQNITGIFVTHDQTEALGVADRIAIMQKGSVLQVDSPRNIYFQPNHEFVARFIGIGQFIQAKILSETRIETDFGIIESDSAIRIFSQAGVQKANPGDQARLFVRPENLCFDAQSTTRAKIVEKIFQGPTYLYSLELDSGLGFQISAPYYFDYQVAERLGVGLDLRREICLFGN